jgi:ABC-type multidrug transport system fused ATPase/permease subunit
MMAEAMGVNTGWMRVVIFVYAAVLASVSGFLYAHLQRAVNPTPFGLNHGIEFLFMAVVGGVSHVWGAVLGAAILTLLQDYLQTLLPKLLGENGNFEVIVFGILMVLLLQYARKGVWPFVARFFPRGPRAHLADHAEPLPQRSKPQAGEDLLTVNKARKQFGGLVAVNDVSFEVKAGQIIGLIGPNGAGKSTTFNLVTGVLQVTSGEITLNRQARDRPDLPARQTAAGDDSVGERGDRRASARTGGRLAQCRAPEQRGGSTSDGGGGSTDSPCRARTAYVRRGGESGVGPAADSRNRSGVVL